MNKSGAIHRNRTKSVQDLSWLAESSKAAHISKALAQRGNDAGEETDE
ncbi:hypothetical protein APS_1159 [Acetobacter pasteurianus subsp. pasteurianus LMG 1262 = NBRC 106471]|nr:hypothetical protein APS_1159 [Acetobacter pasteurianus subsp. pasteurianus LMG 1262 = NBRC 106471]